MPINTTLPISSVLYNGSEIPIAITESSGGINIKTATSSGMMIHANID